jgi:hypothetical protein
MGPFFWFLFLFTVPGVLMLLGCCLFFWLKKTYGFWTYFLLGWTLQILLSLPSGIWQSMFGWPGLTMSGTPLCRRLALPLIAWPFNTAGFSIRYILYVLGKELWGREGVLLQYMLLMYLQGSIVALAFAMRYKQRKTFVDWVILCLGILFLVNSLVNVNWYWGVG